jgi:membrane protease subunit (stomatin/prohibitin family)
MAMGAHSAGTHAFSILARIQHEHRFNNVVPTFKFDDIHTQYGEEIQRYAAEWIVEGTDSKEVAKKVKELTFLNVMIYAMGGWSEGNGFRYAEFTLSVWRTKNRTHANFCPECTSSRAR